MIRNEETKDLHLIMKKIVLNFGDRSQSAACCSSCSLLNHLSIASKLNTKKCSVVMHREVDEVEEVKQHGDKMERSNEHGTATTLRKGLQGGKGMLTFERMSQSYWYISYHRLPRHLLRTLWVLLPDESLQVQPLFKFNGTTKQGESVQQLELPFFV